ncbi:2-C-methyl-D-erythritol 2,4-cyclodiphosphate synthase [Pseudoclavibacter sp. 13-3]|uniref:2-C-methyl-D-erythritol 2,4-cyclodiphosphate synthase n=1 Tax=Pseudoclavibacter sp. 13-3 TaxID=2901228 RepID=UPI001E34DB97|nr:2-C-methyl-D-erythritol 2,4-cyclodiphosphate synthase [Pseudoclavibacter sp. 13-3]MCD7101767.1 2-C-methyl-D-erythritol 2,4-cyclodiphosphate synthase [Pseudoclavibacter sp. 13-3]
MTTAPAVPPREMRTGIASDVHAFGDSGILRLAALDWGDAPALTGHSDGDAVVHAVCDALLSAAGLGDMGEHFGTDRPEYAGARSEVFLQQTLQLVARDGWKVEHVAVQVMTQRPRISPRRREAEKRLTELVDAPVSFAATTADRLGVIGAGAGVLAQAVATLRR